MYPPSMQSPARFRNDVVDPSRRFSVLYFGYSSNLSPTTLKGRCPDSLFCGLARLDGWKWNINSTQYANIVPSKDDVVYGSLFFLSPRDEAGLDESEGVPWLYEKQWHEVTRIAADGSETGQKVKALMYVDVRRPDEGTIMSDYIVWINKAIRDAKPHGLPDEYVERYIRPLIPPTSKEQEDNETEITAVRVMAPKDSPYHTRSSQLGFQSGQSGHPVELDSRTNMLVTSENINPKFEEEDIVVYIYVLQGSAMIDVEVRDLTKELVSRERRLRGINTGNQITVSRLCVPTAREQ